LRQSTATAAADCIADICTTCTRCYKRRCCWRVWFEMSTGDEKSPISLDSDSETSQDIHPVDAVIQQAIYRNRTPTHPPRSNVNVKSGKRKRDPTPPDADVISLHSSSSDEASHDSDREQAENKTSIASGAGKSALVAPTGVTVVEEGAQTRNPEVQRLLRGGRQVFYLQHAVLTPLNRGQLSAAM